MLRLIQKQYEKGCVKARTENIAKNPFDVLVFKHRNGSFFAVSKQLQHIGN